MTKAQTLLNNLQLVLYNNFLAYYPKAIIDLLKDIDYEFTTNMDEVVYIESTKNIVAFETKHLFSVITKKDLNDNCFQLLQYHTELDEHSLLYISKRYLQSLETAVLISYYLAKHFDIQASKKIVDKKHLFILQSHIYITHLVEVEKITGLKSENVWSFITYPSDESTDIPSAELANNSDTLISFKEIHRRLRDKNRNLATSKTIVNDKTNKKPFRDFIIHDNKVEIENIIKKHYSHLKGVGLRRMIEYLKEQNILALPKKEQSAFYNSIIELFGHDRICSKPAIFAIKVFNGRRDADYIELKRLLNQSFKGILPEI